MMISGIGCNKTGWYQMALNGNGWYWVVLVVLLLDLLVDIGGFGYYQMALDGIGLFQMVRYALDGILWYWIVLNGMVCWMGLNGR